MANTTFKGPVRAENGFIGVTKDSDTGAITENITFGNNGLVVTPVALADADANITAATHGGRISVVPALGGNRTLTLPTPTAGIYFKFIYGGAATEAENLIIDTGANANFFIGSIAHLDTNADNAAVYPDGNSNSIFTAIDFGPIEINILGKDSTNWYIWGNVLSATPPTFTDQA